MNAIITCESVSQTIEKLTSAGKKPTQAAILAALGGGSASTLVRVMAQLREQGAAERDNAEVLAAFREFWPLAIESAKKRTESETETLRETIDFLSAEA